MPILSRHPRRVGSLIRDSQGNFYGVTVGGGAFSEGTLFKVTPTGTETMVSSFPSTSPNGGLVDIKGNFYGTTELGGTFNFGSVFKVTPAGRVRHSFNFNKAIDGQYPLAGLVVDSQGNLYGTTPRWRLFKWRRCLQD